MDKLMEKRIEEVNAKLTEKYGEKRGKRYAQAGIESNDLPAIGKFGTYYDAGDGDFMHPRMQVIGTDGKPTGQSISLSNIKLSAPLDGTVPRFGKMHSEDAKINGKAFLRGSAVNPHFSRYSVAETIAILENRNFEAKPVDVLVLGTFAPDFETVSEKDLAVKKAFVITLK